MTASPFETLYAKPPVFQFHLGDMRNFIYLIADLQTKKAALIDCQYDLAVVEELIQKLDLDLESIFLTHSHHDHMAGIDAALTRYPHLNIYVHPDETHRIRIYSENEDRFEMVNDGQSLNIGSLKIKTLHTPGHSKGECSYLLEGGYLFTGDTLFIRDCGRTDFEGGNNQEMFESLQKIKSLPPETKIFCGHYYAKEAWSTLAVELETSPPLKCASVKELSELP